MAILLKWWILAMLVGLTKTTSPPVLLVKTIIQEPFVIPTKTSDTDKRYGFKGILIDMLADFVATDGFSSDVKLQLAEHAGKKEKDGTWSGLIGEMSNDTLTAFGLADVTVNSERMDVVQFSIPFLTTGLSAVAKGINFTINQDNLSKLLKMAQDDKITVGCEKGVSSEHFLQGTNITVYKKLYEQMKKSDDNFVKNTEDGIAKVRKAPADKPFVFFEEKAYLEYYAGKAPCDLKVSSETLNTHYFALVFSKQKSQGIVNHYNKLIVDYLSSGKMEVSIKKWYKNECNSTSD